MKVDNETINKLAHLARLEFDEKEQEKIREDLEKITAFCEQLNAVDTTGVEPLIYLNEEVNILREDEVKEDITHQQALQNAPRKDSDYFKVPRVLGK